MPVISYPQCRVCYGARRDDINAMLGSGVSRRQIEERMKEQGFPIKAEAVAKHFDRCLQGDIRNIEFDEDVREAARKAALDGVKPGTKDFAVLVHDEAIKMLNRGQIRVSTKDGLAARALLDRRDERAEDRQFMMNLAQLLSGGGQGAPVGLIEAGDEAIEGTFTEVEGGNPLLAPANLRE